ncbi:hypothetical protein COCON_G00090060 [Conger conger]|uniref:C-C motif chemokine n=1 Tax=Conger conger TaxID=82655 RepID=A0A9Q1DLN2_CONCO|nr:hypothetical protein COCON_G00090060 [Conger conger]
MMTLPAVFLCLGVLLLSPGPGEANASVIKCCLRVSDMKIPVSRIARYEKQMKGLCPIEAIIFTTVKGLTYCSGLNQWAARVMHIMDGKITTLPNPSMLSTTEKTVHPYPSMLSTTAKSHTLRY